MRRQTMFASKKEKGSAMVEFALVLPGTITFVALLIYVGILAIQTSVLSDSVRIGSRNAALSSNSTTACSAIIQKAKDETLRAIQSYNQSAIGAGIFDNWSQPQAVITDGSWDSFNYKTVKVELVSSGGQCQYCPGGLLFSEGVKISASFLLDKPCV